MANPAGDMIRLIQWLADTGARWAGGLKSGAVHHLRVVDRTRTTSPPSAQVQVNFAHAGSVSIEFAVVNHATR